MAYYEDSFTAGYKKRFNIYKGLSSGNFEYGSTTVSEGIEKIRQNVLTLLTVPRGSLFFNPSYGSGLDNLLFEPNDFILRDTVERYLTSQIETYLKDIRVENIQVEVYNEYLNIDIHYYILSIGYYDDIAIIKKRSVASFD